MNNEIDLGLFYNVQYRHVNSALFYSFWNLTITIITVLSSFADIDFYTMKSFRNNICK